MNPRSNTTPSGEQVGRLIIKDLALVHKNAREEISSPAPLSTEDKATLVNSLTGPADVAAYNEYRYFHEFLSRASLFFNLHLQSAEAAYWKLWGALECLRLAETENCSFLTELPRVMTPAEYEQNRNLFNPSGGQGFGRGVAVCEFSSFPKNTYKTGKNGHFQYPMPGRRQMHMAENFLRRKEEITAQLEGYCDALREALVIKTAVEIAGQFLKVPELSYLVSEVDLGPAEHLNKLMAEIPPLIRRSGLSLDEEGQEELRSRLAQTLRPINIKKLKPTAKARAMARRAMNFDVARGNSEKIYAILRQQEDE